MISVAIIDDHPAVQIGLRAALRSEPGLVPVGCASTLEEIEPLLYETRPDVVLLDYQLPDSDGLTLCRRIKDEVPAPAVLMYSAFADDSLIVPAIVASADGLVHKAAPPRELYEAVRVVAAGGRAHPTPRRELVRSAAAQLEPEDQPILGMLVEGVAPTEIASALRMQAGELRERLAGMLDRLRTPGRATGSTA